MDRPSGRFRVPHLDAFMIDVGLIGFGLAGRAFHAQVISRVPGLRLAAILQRSGNEAAEQFPEARIVRSAEELLSISEIRLVVIATPNDSHYFLAHKCLAAGRDVLVDKPFTTTVEEAVALVEFAKQQGFQVIVTNTRESNLAMIHLNLKMGFQIRGSAPHFYIEPDEAAIVMELRLQAGNPNTA